MEHSYSITPRMAPARKQSSPSSSAGSSPNCVSNSRNDNNPDDATKPMPLQRRNTRELHDEICGLRNEIFNLKLRLYVKEEDQLNMSRGLDKGNMAEELIQAKQQIEELNKEIEAKIDLLKDATTAITRHEEIYREHVVKTQSELAKQEEYINLLESKIDKQSADNSMETSNLEKIKLLEDKVVEQHEELATAKSQIASLEAKLSQSDKSIELYVDEINDLKKQKADLMQLGEEHCAITALSNKMLEIQKIELEICTKEKMELQRIIDTVTPEIVSQKEVLQEAVTALGVMQGRENLLLTTLDDYERRVLVSNRNIRNYIDEIRNITRLYQDQIGSSDLSQSETESDDGLDAAAKIRNTSRTVCLNSFKLSTDSEALNQSFNN